MLSTPQFLLVSSLVVLAVSAAVADHRPHPQPHRRIVLPTSLVPDKDTVLSRCGTRPGHRIRLIGTKIDIL